MWGGGDQKSKGPRFEVRKNTLKERRVRGSPTKRTVEPSLRQVVGVKMGFTCVFPKSSPTFFIATILSLHPLPPNSHSRASTLISCQQAAVPLTLAVGLGGAPLALTTDAPGAAHQMEVGVTSELHPGSIQSWEVPTRQENLPIFQGQIRLGADSDTAAGCVHIRPGAVGQAFAHLGPHHLALPTAHVFDLIVHRQEVDGLHLVASQATVPDATFPGRMYNLATFRGGVGGLRPASAQGAEEERHQQQQQHLRKRQP